MNAAAEPQQFIALYFQVVDSLRKANNSHFAKLQAYPSTTGEKNVKIGHGLGRSNPLADVFHIFGTA